MASVKQIIEHIEKIAPPDMALPEDPSGFQIGDRNREVDKIMVALDASYQTVRQAVGARAGLLVSHHPLIYRPLSLIDLGTETGKTVALCLEGEVAVYSAHTSLDASPGGINASLADTLGLVDRQALAGSGRDRVKLVTFVPAGSAEEVRQALFQAGGGRVGAYSSCSFAAAGEGTFFGDAGTDPAIGRSGVLEKVPELRLEVVIDRVDLDPAVSSLRSSHPYEEVAVDLYPLVNYGGGHGMGVVGNLPSSVPAVELAGRLREVLGFENIRVAGDIDRVVGRVALCAGSGASLLGAALASGADIYITGDLKYHEAREAEEAGFCVLDIGHFAPERFGMEVFARTLGDVLMGSGLEVELEIASEWDPFRSVT